MKFPGVSKITMSSNQAKPDEFIPLKPLPPGGTIGIFSPSSPVEPDRLKRGISYLESKGFRTITTKSCHASLAYLAGTGRERASDLMQLINDPKVDAVFATRGGFGSMMMLPHLDYDAIRAARKLILGFSDVTALQWSIWHRCGLPSISAGMVGTDLAKETRDPQFEHFFRTLLETGQVRVPLEPYPSSVKMEGIMMPGTVSVAAMLLGSDYMPDLRGTIPVFEDVLEPMHKVEAYLQQFRLGGHFDGLNGVITGRYTPAEQEEYPEVPDFNTILDRVFGDKTYPVIQNIDYGHIPGKISLPVGVPISVSLGPKSYLSTTQSLFET